ncbi:phospholipase A [Litorilituus sediminis]|nr:phospholipase A [Litorilituus sediminis]
MTSLSSLAKLTLLSSFTWLSCSVKATQSPEHESYKNFEKEAYEQCMFKTIKAANKESSLTEIEAYCEKEVAKKIINRDIDKPQEEVQLGALAQRVIRERRTAFNPYVITPHRMNYILPISVSDDINSEAYSGYSNWEENLTDSEAKFQISIKVPLLTDNLFVQGDQVFFAFTLQSWWQVYSDNISKPFRETNYQPEFFYFAPLGFHPFGGNSAMMFGLEHQSNGRSQQLSRSWNRVYLSYLYEKNNFALSLRPWIRIEEETKSNPLDEGDDNPDISDYMGHFELTMVYKLDQDYELSFKGRENFASHKGFAELGITFPLWGKLKGYAQFSSGYGESLIDYNYNQKRIGIGIALTDLL